MSVRSRSVPLLAPGSTVGVVAPGFAVRRRPLEAGLARLRSMGYAPRIGSHVLDREGYLAGTDDQRLADLETMLTDPEVAAIWFARGGYGTARLLERLPWRRLRRAPKLLIGYSDLTALFGAAIGRTGSVCLYGPVVTELGDAASYHGPSLRRLLRGEPVEIALRPAQVLRPGRARGRLMGGNLSVLSHLCGTRWFPDLRGAVLLLEEVGEEAYRIDRMLTQLSQAGAFRALAGVVLGRFDVPTRRRFPPDRNPADLLEEAFGALEVPVVRGLPVGHCRGKRTVPLGGQVLLDTRRGRARFSP